MKYILFAIVLTILNISLFASDTTIIFTQTEYAKLFDLAKKENRSVMLYFHFDGCGACMKMENTAFNDKQVYEFYNANFINFEINTRKEPGKEINKVYNVQLHPTFLFLDNSGNEIHKLVGVFSPGEFLTQAQNAIRSNKTLTNYKKQYNAGNRTAEFLFEYTYMLRDASELDAQVVNQYLDALEPNELTLEKNLRYIYEFSLHNYVVCLPFKNPHFTFLLQNKETFYNYFDEQQIDTRIVWILNSAIYAAIASGDEKTFFEAIDLLREFDTGESFVFKEMDGRVTGMITSKNLVLLSLMDFYAQKGDTENYTKTLDAYMAKIWNDANELNNFAWGVYEDPDTVDRQKISAAIQCSIRSIELNNNYAYNDTYACLLYKSGEHEKALKQANKAIEIARETNTDYSETQQLIDKINASK